MVQANVLALHMQPSVITIGDVTSYGTAAAADTPERARVGMDPASGKPCIRCEGVETLARQHGPRNVVPSVRAWHAVAEQWLALPVVV